MQKEKKDDYKGKNWLHLLSIYALSLRLIFIKLCNVFAYLTHTHILSATKLCI